jgi:hypothetical protein
MADETRALDRTLQRVFPGSSAQSGSGGAMAVLAKPIDTDGAQLGRIVDSVRHGFYERTNIGHTLMASTFAVLLDFMPFIFALLLVKPPVPATATNRPEPKPQPTKVPGRPDVLNQPSRSNENPKVKN